MNRRQYIIIIILAFFIGALGSILIGRFFIPYLATTFGLESLNKLATSSPIIVNRTQEIQLNEGVNLIDLTKQSGNFSVTVLSAGENPTFLGNGVIMSSDGLIFTSKSVLQNREQAVVLLNNGNTYPALVRAVDPKSDIAALTIDERNLPVPTFGDSLGMAVGQRILAIGSTNLPFNQRFAQGYVTNTVLNKATDPWRVVSSEVLENAFDTDAQISSPNFAGSPLFNLNGRLIGMATGPSGSGIVISENIQTALNSYLSDGSIVRPRMGITYSQLAASSAQMRGLDRAGVLVMTVDPRGPSATVLRVDDYIIEIDGQNIDNRTLEQIINQKQAGETRFKILRGSEELEVVVNLLPTS